MSKKKLFDDELEEEEVDFKTENEYAKKYDNWREKEELHKLEQKYGSKGQTSDASLSSESEDDEPPEVSEEVETKFLKTLALLKTKDPRIYDPSYTFFEEKEEIKEEKPKAKALTFEDSDEDDSEDGNIFKIEKKAEIRTREDMSTKDGTKSKEGKLKDFLTGKVEHVDEEDEKDLQPLRALWSDPELNESEAFLRDYILNKRYLEDGDAADAEQKIRDDEDLEEDEKRVEEQGKFERAYNFRFEEPDDEYLKRYPRTMNYTRPKDDRRARKRAEVRTRKEEEKRRKMDEIGRMKALKLKEIQEKLAKIKEVTGNEDLAFEEHDIEGDFDPEEHDRRMRALFDEQYYGEADNKKPVFPDLDEELEIENWDKYEMDRGDDDQTGNDDDGLHCEDEDFNMDADYDPKKARANLLEEIQSTLGKKRRNRKKKSKLAQLLSSEKPKFIPSVAKKTYNEYMEEYYKMDCEDVIGGDLPTRFKYREVVPNDYGLTVEEILLADDKELTQWVPLKKIVKHRAKDTERSEVNTYRQKAQDVHLKRKILPSLFKDLPEDPEIVVPIEGASKKKKKKNKKGHSEDTVLENTNRVELDVSDNTELTSEQNDNKDNKKIQKEVVENDAKVGTNDSNLESKIRKSTKRKNYLQIDDKEQLVTGDPGLLIKKGKEQLVTGDPGLLIKKGKKQRKNSVKQEGVEEIVIETNAAKVNGSKKKKKSKQSIDNFIVESLQNVEPSHSGHEGVGFSEIGKPTVKRKLNQQNFVTNKKHKKFDVKRNKNKFNKNDKRKNKLESNATDNPLSKLSDERLKAYGLNPKKYKNFLKYKKF